MNLAAVAAYLHMAEHEVERLVQKNKIPYEKSGGRLVFRTSEIESWASRRLLDADKGRGHFAADFHKRSTDTHFGEPSGGAIIPQMLTPGRIEPELGARTRSSVISEMTMLADATGFVNNPVDLLESLRAREELCSTAMPGGIALLHPRHHHEYLFEESFIVLGRAVQAIPFGAPDGKMTDLFFLICCGDDRLHLHTLARLAAICNSINLVADLRLAATAEELYELLVAAEEQVVLGMHR